MVIGTITVDNVTWTPLKPPSDCYHVRLYNPNAVAIKFRTNSTDANTETPIQSLTVFEVRGTRNAHFNINSIIGFAQMASGSPSPITLIAEN